MAEEKKRLSVQEMLAAARAEKAGGAKQDPPKSAAPAEAAGGEAAASAGGEAAASAGGEAAASAGGEAAASAGGETPAAAKPKPAGGKMSVADMLAAARAEKSGGAKPAAAPKPVEKPAPKPVEKKPTAAAPAEKVAKAPVASEPKDTGSILAGERKANKPGPMSKEEAAKAKPEAPPKPAKEPVAKIAVPPMPVKPDYAKPKAAKDAAEAGAGRRSWLFGALFGAMFGSSLAVGFTTMCSTFTLWLLGSARFMFPNILTEPPSKFRIGEPKKFSPDTVDDSLKAQWGIWVVNTEYNGQRQIVALRTVCTHLGCTPNWLESEKKFKCPCHGSGFYRDGINFEGPAPRPLERYAIRVADDGQLEVDKSKIFQEELGQWSDPACFVPA